MKELSDSLFASELEHLWLNIYFRKYICVHAFKLNKLNEEENETATFDFKIKSHITCETSNVMYMIHCTKSNLQYIGETKRRLKDRFNEHRRQIINPFRSYIPTAVSRHFLTSDHAEDHMILIPLEQLHTFPASRGLSRRGKMKREERPLPTSCLM